MDEERASRFMFPQTLTDQTRPIGLPMDETIALSAPMGWGFIPVSTLPVWLSPFCSGSV